MKEGITIGMDLGDRSHQVCILAAQGQILEERSIGGTRRAVEAFLGGYGGARLVIETGTHSRWVSQVGLDAGLEVLVGNARRLRAIWTARRKSDVRDAEMLARIGRLDPRLLYGIRHRSVEAQADLALLKARDQLVRVRSDLINHVRGVVKSFGHRLPKCSTAAFHRRAVVPAELEPALGVVVEQIGELTRKIRLYDARIEQTATRYPEVGSLVQVTGVGTLTALAYVLILEDADRFECSRAVGPYLGLVPRQDQSGSSDRQLRITKEGDKYLRQLLVGSAHYILGPFGPQCDLRRHGLRIMERGGKNAKKRAVVAVARKLAVLMHALWTQPGAYEPDRQLKRAA